MTIFHANDPTTRFLSLLYQGREDIRCHITEKNTNVDVLRALRNDDTFMMLGHGNPYGLFSVPNKEGSYERFLITGRHVQFLRDKLCIGIWCYAEEFALRYGLHGLFSGMVISELDEARMFNIEATQGEIIREREQFVHDLLSCIRSYGLKETPEKMLQKSKGASPLTRFNYESLYFIE